MNKVIAARQEGPVRVLIIDNPPVNALGLDVRRALIEALQAAEQDADTRIVVLASAGKLFSGGADIREFAGAAKSPTMPEMCTAVENCGKPVVVSIQGEVLGAGLELGISAHYRIALANAKAAFPEVTLALLPGAGGTQRTPRLTGVAAALDLILSGRKIDAREAQAIGLFDRVTDDDDPVAAGLTYAQELLRDGAQVNPTARRGFTDVQRKEGGAALDKARAEQTGPDAPPRLRIVDVVGAALDMPFDEGMRFERESFLKCRESTEHKGLVHAFMAERAASEAPEERQVDAQKLSIVGLVGSGAAAAGVVAAALDARLAVVAVVSDDVAARELEDGVTQLCDQRIAKGRMTEAERGAWLERLHVGNALDALTRTQLVVDCSDTELAAREALLASIESRCGGDTVIATDARAADFEQLAQTRARAEHLVGLHFVPASGAGRLVEVGVTSTTSALAVARAFAFVKKLRKQPVRVVAGEQYVGDSLMRAARAAAGDMIGRGVPAARINSALRAFGLKGIDLSQGADASAASGNHEDISDDDIVKHYVGAMINAGARAVHSGQVRRPLDVDVVMLAGYGFPRSRGGPMKYADAVGLPAISAALSARTRVDPANAVSPLFASLISGERSFDDMNRPPKEAHATK